MGASIYVRWPGNSEEQQGDHPGFWNDDAAYASWITNILDDATGCSHLRGNGFAALLHVYPAENPDRMMRWTTPAELKGAALRLSDELLRESPLGLSVVKFYDKGPGVEPPSTELARDLADVASIAQYALDHGAENVALTIGW